MLRQNAFKYIILVAAVVSVVLAYEHRGSNAMSFYHFKQNIAKQAKKAGVTKETLRQYLHSVPPPKTSSQKTTIYKDETHQAQAVLDFNTYRNQFINPTRIKHGQQAYKKHFTLLWQVAERYNVQPRFIVALWGLESDYGQDMGHFSLMQSLLYLAFSNRRSEFFKQQVIDALVILNRGHLIPAQLKSSFDGGMGQTQLMPSSYLNYAVDFDHSGFKNIWTNLPDIFASIANYLKQNGWNGHQTWGMEVKLPSHFPLAQSSYLVRKPISYWNKLGVRQLNGKPLPSIKGDTSIITPNHTRKIAYVAFPNFYVLFSWNHTTFESLSAGILADHIINVPVTSDLGPTAKNHPEAVKASSN